MILVPCLCGGKAKHVLRVGKCMISYVCDTCEYKTKSYYDGAEYAASDWNKRNKPREDGQGTLKFEPRR